MEESSTKPWFWPVIVSSVVLTSVGIGVGIGVGLSSGEEESSSSKLSPTGGDGGEEGVTSLCEIQPSIESVEAIISVSTGNNNDFTANTDDCISYELFPLENNAGGTSSTGPIKLCNLPYPNITKNHSVVIPGYFQCGVSKLVMSAELSSANGWFLETASVEIVSSECREKLFAAEMNLVHPVTNKRGVWLDTAPFDVDQSYMYGGFPVSSIWTFDLNAFPDPGMYEVLFRTGVGLDSAISAIDPLMKLYPSNATEGAIEQIFSIQSNDNADDGYFFVPIEASVALYQRKERIRKIELASNSVDNYWFIEELYVRYPDDEYTQVDFLLPFSADENRTGIWIGLGHASDFDGCACEYSPAYTFTPPTYAQGLNNNL